MQQSFNQVREVTKCSRKDEFYQDLKTNKEGPFL